MKIKNIRKMAAIAAVVLLAAQSGIMVYGAGEIADNKSDDTVSVLTDIKCPDITLEKGELKPFCTSSNFCPGDGYENKLLFVCGNSSIAVLANDKNSGEILSPAVEKKVGYGDFYGDTYVYGVKAGETTYKCTDRDGNLLGEGKITVKVPEEINDPVLEKTDIKPVKVFAVESDSTSPMAYILYDNGLLCTFKNGTMSRYRKNIKDAAIDGSDIYTLSDEGVVYINGKAVNDPAEYTVVSANRLLTHILCSDGCIRRISDGRAEKILENINAMDETFGSNHVISGVVQTKDGNTDLIWIGPDDDYLSYTLEEKFKPVRICQMNPNKDGGVYFVLTEDGKIYQIAAELPVKDIEGYSKLSDNKVSVWVKLIAEDVVDMYNHYYITSDGKSYLTYSGKSDYDWKYNYFLDLINYGKISMIQRVIDEYAKETQYFIPDNKEEIFYSIREKDGTERYDFIKNSKPLTHVKENYGIYRHDEDKCVLIQREDDRLWKYVIETGELARVDADINRSYNATDIVSMKRFIYGIGEVAGWMDINGNGEVNIMDLVLLKKAILNGNSD